MTGFGLAKAQSQFSIFEVSVRAVNGRFLEARFHLPRELFAFESELKTLMQKHFARGTVDIFITRKSRPGHSAQQIFVNKELAKQYLAAYKGLAKDLKLKADFHVETIARLPEVLKSEDLSELGSEENKFLVAAFKDACEAADRERKREGKGLAKDLEEILRQLDILLEEVQAVREEANQNLQQKFEQKIKTRLASLELDPVRLSQEVVIQLEKSDINEEVSRLREHLRNYRELISSHEPVGKKLDFYTQELLREVNTIGSKSSLSKLTQTVVQAKTLIERLREQVQNVE